MTKRTFLWTEPVAQPCETCGDLAPVTERRSTKDHTYYYANRFCSDECRDAGVQKLLIPTGSPPPAPVGSKRVTSDGYVTMKVPPDHVMAGTNGDWVLQHRAVMAEMIGRALESHENVHHKNGNRADNRPENLELWDKGQPAGQRIDEKRHCDTCTCQPHTKEYQ